jgi:hypothetical protein
VRSWGSSTQFYDVFHRIFVIDPDFTVDFGLILPPAIRICAGATRFLPMIFAEEFSRPEDWGLSTI